MARDIVIPPMRWIVEDGAQATLLNVKMQLRFLAGSLLRMGDQGFEFSDDEADACFRMLHSMSDAIESVRESLDTVDR